MKTKKLAPRNSAPVKRSNVATVSPNHQNAIAPAIVEAIELKVMGMPFAGDDAE